MTHVVILGGGPGGYESALVAAQLGAEVTVVDRDGLGGSAVLTDCVPSKTLIATAEVMAQTEVAGELGITFGVEPDGSRDRTADASVDLAAVDQRVLELGSHQRCLVTAGAASDDRHVSHTRHCSILPGEQPSLPLGSPA